MNSNSYDYIIAGGGMAGLSLAFHLNESVLREKKVLIIDREEKSSNDHTWCFWESGRSAFETIVFHKWKKLRFYDTEGKELSLDLAPGGLEYKMIRASDFYSLVIPRLRSNSSIEFLKAEIRGVGNGTVDTTSGRFEARELVFDSVTLPNYDDPGDNNLLQHFYGRLIETDTDVFTPDAATLFDFRVPQKGDCRFVYILPESPRKALVEYTVFSDSILSEEEYEEGLNDHIRDVLGIVNYRSLEVERGVIPMSDAVHETNPSARVVRIGTAGGYVKPSTGYSFGRTQERLEKIVNALEVGDAIPDFRSIRGKWKMLLDSVFLNVLGTGKHEPADVFARLFRKNSPEKVLDFLDERTGLAGDLRLMSTVPLSPFTKAAFEELVRTVFRRRR